MGDDVASDHRVLLEVKLDHFLSFGPDTVTLELRNLNILIGPNGSGKSNFIEALSLMRATPGDIRRAFKDGGRVGEWVWRGTRGQYAAIEVVVSYPRGNQLLHHAFLFCEDEKALSVLDERIETPLRGKEWFYFYRFEGGHPVVNTAPSPGSRRGKPGRRLDPESVSADQSILSQRRDPELYPEITYLSDLYEGFRIYREWSFGRNTIFRHPQKADMRNDRLEEDFSNLGLVLNRLRRTSKAKKAILEGLHDLYEEVTDFDVSVEGGSVQVFLSEGDFTVPATRLSDGTLRYLCLLAILCDPEPPPLICIEEPELGLHPDILPKLADHLRAASQRTQLIVTTHSDILVDSMTESPETVVVFEKHDGCSSMRRLDKDDLAVWLDKYRLGQLWIKGQIGGTRW